MYGDVEGKNCEVLPILINLQTRTLSLKGYKNNIGCEHLSSKKFMCKIENFTCDIM